MDKNRNLVSILNAPSRLHGAHALIVRGDSVSRREELLTGEEPLQIRAAGPGQEPQDVAITMRTPGSERALAIGFLVSEGLVSASDAPDASFEFGDPAVIAQPEDEGLVRLPKSLDLSSLAERHFVATASCGICGRATLDELMARVDPIPAGPIISRSALELMPETMRAAQVAFAQTGGIHAAALFSASGDLIELHEDVGRHNALDKVVGSQALAGRLPLHVSVLLVSGRVSFEIVQKAATAGIPSLAAVSAPSDLAIETAERLGMTVIGFLRGNGFNVYTGEERILPRRIVTADSQEPIAASAIVLAGGRSSRFGADKLAAQLEGEPLLHHSTRAVAGVCVEVLVVGAPSGLTVTLPDDLAVKPLVVLDVDSYEGPLVALVDAARRANHERLLVVGGDMPDLQHALLRRVLSWGDDYVGACLRADGWTQPFPMGLDREAAISAGESLMSAGERSLRRLIETLAVEVAPEEEWRALDAEARSLRDIDRPEDLEPTS